MNPKNTPIGAKGHVTFEHVRLVIHQIPLSMTLTAEASQGQKVAIVGPTGR